MDSTERMACMGRVQHLLNQLIVDDASSRATCIPPTRFVHATDVLGNEDADWIACMSFGGSNEHGTLMPTLIAIRLTSPLLRIRPEARDPEKWIVVMSKDNVPRRYDGLDVYQRRYGLMPCQPHEESIDCDDNVTHDLDNTNFYKHKALSPKAVRTHMLPTAQFDTIAMYCGVVDKQSHQCVVHMVVQILPEVGDYVSVGADIPGVVLDDWRAQMQATIYPILRDAINRKARDRVSEVIYHLYRSPGFGARALDALEGSLTATLLAHTGNTIAS